MPSGWWDPNHYWGGISPTTGNPQDWWNTGWVQDDVLASDDANRGVWQRFLTDQGMPSFGRQAQLARNMYNPSLGGLDAARLSNPALTYYDYLQELGPNFLQNQIMGMTQQERGDYIPGRTTWLRR